MLGDLDISKAERRRRAKGLRIMGEIYEKVGATEYRRKLKEEEKKRKEEADADGHKGKEKAETESSKDDAEEALAAEPPMPTNSNEDID